MVFRTKSASIADASGRRPWSKVGRVEPQAQFVAQGVERMDQRERVGSAGYGHD